MCLTLGRDGAILSDITLAGKQRALCVLSPPQHQASAPVARASRQDHASTTDGGGFVFRVPTMPRPTAGPLVRAECLRCLNRSARMAFDAHCTFCAIYRCSPFRGRLLAKSDRPMDFDEQAEKSELAALLNQFPKRRPSMSLIAARCRQCNAEGEADCDITDCTFYPVRPMKPGGREKRPRSEAQQAADKAAGLRLAQQKVSSGADFTESGVSPAVSGGVTGESALCACSNGQVALAL